MNAPEGPDRTQPPGDDRPRWLVAAVLAIVASLVSVGAALLVDAVAEAGGVRESAQLASIVGGLAAALVAALAGLLVLPIHRRRASSSGGLPRRSEPTVAARTDDATRSLDEETAEAVSRLEGVIRDMHRSSQRDQVLFFVIGVVASIPMQIVANWVTG